jgi:hypothetical protein
MEAMFLHQGDDAVSGFHGRMSVWTNVSDGCKSRARANGVEIAVALGRNLQRGRCHSNSAIASMPAMQAALSTSMKNLHGSFKP